MADAKFEKGALTALTDEGGPIGVLAKDPKLFNVAYEAFREQDATAYQDILKRLDLLPKRLEICEWIRSKECVFVCLGLAGPPQPQRQPDPRLLAEAIVRITVDDAAVKALVHAVETRDSARFMEFVKQHELQPLIHLFCHWVCVVRHRLICRQITTLVAIERPDFAAELQLAGKALRGLLASDGAFADAVAASDAGDANRLAAIIDRVGLRALCPLICEFFCSWRCTFVCLDFARSFPPKPIPLAEELREARTFALATQKLATDAANLAKLSAAVGAADVKAFSAIVKELKLDAIALQLCHWICVIRCRLHCAIVCPPVKCAITSPLNCTAEEVDPIAGALFVKVLGTAGGSGSYTLKIQADGDPPIAGVVSYPGAAANGTAPVINGVLGQINTTTLSDSAYTITLEVHSGNLKTPIVCTVVVTFNLLKRSVYISQIAGHLTLPSPSDEAAEFLSGSDVASFGGGLAIEGSAYVYGCAGQKIERYEMRHARVAAPGPAPLQPPPDAAVPDADWPTANRLIELVYAADGSQYLPWTRIGQAARNLMNTWGTVHEGAPAPGGTDYPRLVGGSWNSHIATDEGGRYNLLLIVRDTLGHHYYDVQRIWIDNWQVLCKIVKFQRPGPGDTWIDIPPCTDILLSWAQLRIMGMAWDHLIDDTWAPTTVPAIPPSPPVRPNDNFNRYDLSFHKQFVSSDVIPGATPTLRVPNNVASVPGDADAGVLATWNLAALDAGVKPPENSCDDAPGNTLYQGCSCTYDLSLSVSDTTVSDEPGTHNPSVTQPIKIVNDIA